MSATVIDNNYDQIPKSLLWADCESNLHNLCKLYDCAKTMELDEMQQKHPEATFFARTFALGGL